MNPPIDEEGSAARRLRAVDDAGPVDRRRPKTWAESLDPKTLLLIAAALFGGNASKLGEAIGLSPAVTTEKIATLEAEVRHGRDEVGRLTTGLSSVNAKVDGIAHDVARIGTVLEERLPRRRGGGQ